MSSSRPHFRPLNGGHVLYLMYLSTTFFRRATTAIFSAILLLVAALSAGLGIRAWQIQKTGWETAGAFTPRRPQCNRTQWG